MAHFFSYANTRFVASRCKIHRYVAAPREQNLVRWLKMEDPMGQVFYNS
jgi:hypothetical protein